MAREAEVDAGGRRHYKCVGEGGSKFSTPTEISGGIIDLHANFDLQGLSKQGNSSGLPCVP